MHAAGESVRDPVASGTYAIALGVPDEEELEALAQKLEHHHVPVHRIVEEQGPYHGHLMALGIEPGLKSKRRRFLGSLSLLNMQLFDENQQAVRRWCESRRALQDELDMTWVQRIKRWWKA